MRGFCQTVIGIDYSQLKYSPLIYDMRYLEDHEKCDLFKVQILRYSINTIKTYAKKCKDFFDFCTLKTNKIFPVNKSILSTFMIYLSKSGKSFGVLKSLISSLDFICKIFGYETVGAEFSIKNSLKFIEKVSLKITKPRKPLTIEILNQLCINVEKNGGTKNLSFVQHRTFIMIIVNYFSLMRFDCIQKVLISDLLFMPDFIKIHVCTSKTDQTGDGQAAYVVSTSQPHDPYHLTREYLDKLISKFGPKGYFLPGLVYNRTTKSYDKISGKPICYSTALSSFKRFLSDFGINPNQLSLHSMRIGGTTDDFRLKLNSHVLDKKGRWKNPSTKLTYYKDYDSNIVNEIKKSFKKRTFQ